MSPPTITYTDNDGIDRISNPENYRGQCFWIHKEHCETEQLIKRHVSAIELKHPEAWIKTIEYSAFEDLQRQVADLQNQIADLITQRNKKIRADFQKFGAEHGMSQQDIDDAATGAIALENLRGPASVATLQDAENLFRTGTPASLEDIEIACIKAALKRYPRSKQKAADALGICKATLYNKIVKYGLAKKPEAT